MRSTTATGQKAESAARVYLEMRGYLVLEQNFRRSGCEIDIVARKGSTVYLVEVKYRANDAQGSGFDAITPSKLRQMSRAAVIWSEDTKWDGPIQLSAIEIGGPTFAIMNFVDNAY